MRSFCACCQFFQRELRNTRVLIWKMLQASAAHKFDHVSAHAYLSSNSSSHSVHAITLHTLSIAMSSRNAQRHTASADIRSHYNSIRNSAAQLDAGIAGQSLITHIGDALIC